MKRFGGGLVSVALAGAVVLSGCGVPVEESSRDAKFQPDRLELSLPTTSVVTVAPSTTITEKLVSAVILYFISGEGLVSRVRIFDSDFDAGEILTALATVPVDDTSGVELSTGLAGDGVIEAVEIVGRTAVVELGEGFTQLAGNEQILVLGQVTMTLISSRLAREVSFTDSGEQVAVPDGNGEPQIRPMLRNDYRVLLSR
ncbi:MAG: hypothetical protein RJA16_1395 [Planctomycetota bacterium]